jgi:hypothetical protein
MSEDKTCEHDRRDKELSEQETHQAAPIDSRRSEQMMPANRGVPGEGAGRREEVGHTGVYPFSASGGASGDAPLIGQQEWGQGDRGAPGYENSGDSELFGLGSPVEEQGERQDQKAASDSVTTGEQRNGG